MKYFAVFALICCLLGTALAALKNRKFFKEIVKKSCWNIPLYSFIYIVFVFFIAYYLLKQRFNILIQLLLNFVNRAFRL